MSLGRMKGGTKMSSGAVMDRLWRVPLSVVLSVVAYLLLLTTLSVAYSGVSGLGSVWSGVSGWYTIHGGSSATLTADANVVSLTTVSIISLLPTVFGTALLVSLLCSLTYIVTRDPRVVILVALAGMVGVVGVVLLQSIVTGFLGG